MEYMADCTKTIASEQKWCPDTFITLPGCFRRRPQNSVEISQPSDLVSFTAKALRLFSVPPAVPWLRSQRPANEGRGGISGDSTPGSHNLLQSLLSTVVERAVCDPSFQYLQYLQDVTSPSKANSCTIEQTSSEKCLLFRYWWNTCREPHIN